MGKITQVYDIINCEVYIQYPGHYDLNLDTIVGNMSNVGKLSHVNLISHREGAAMI